MATMPGVVPETHKVRSAAVLLPAELQYEDGARDALRVAEGQPHASV
jgi:hypothetical protein